MDQNVSVEDKYGPAMEIVAQDQADAYFEQCIGNTMAWDFCVVAVSRLEAERIERGNLRYFSERYNQEVQSRVKKLFKL